MDGTPSLFQRLRSTIFYLGAGFLLAEISRALLAWLQFLSELRKANAEPAKDASHATVAVLIDGENISSQQAAQVVEFALEEARKLGEVTIRRVYGNCSLFNQNNNIWNDTSLHFELEQIHLIRPTIYKNTADIALAINAIELAKDGACSHFCIVTSDSDFTPLARRLRELKCHVLGIGDKRTPATLVKACHRFVYTDHLTKTSSTSRSPSSEPRSHTPSATPDEASGESQSAPSEQQSPEHPSQTVIRVLKGAYLDAAHVRGDWVLLSRLGLSLRRLYPDFKATAYAEDLSALIQMYPDVFEFAKRPNGHPQMRLKA